MRTADDVRRYVADVLLRLDADELPTEKGRAILYGCGILRQTVEATDLEQRLTALEERLKEDAPK